jgi:hypothetical protein
MVGLAVAFALIGALPSFERGIFTIAATFINGVFGWLIFFLVIWAVWQLGKRLIRS